MHAAVFFHRADTKLTRTYLKIESEKSIRYKRWMVRLLDSSNGDASGSTFRRRTFPMAVPGRKPVPTRLVLEAVLVDFEHRRTVAHAAAVLSELQNCTSALPDVVSQRDATRSFDRHRQRALRAAARWMKKNVSSTRPLRWPRAAVQRSVRTRSAERA